jgi:hypothetical protein
MLWGGGLGWRFGRQSATHHMWESQLCVRKQACVGRVHVWHLLRAAACMVLSCSNSRAGREYLLQRLLRTLAVVCIDTTGEDRRSCMCVRVHAWPQSVASLRVFVCCTVPGVWGICMGAFVTAAWHTGSLLTVCCTLWLAASCCTVAGVLCCSPGGALFAHAGPATSAYFCSDMLGHCLAAPQTAPKVAVTSVLYGANGCFVTTSKQKALNSSSCCWTRDI